MYFMHFRYFRDCRGFIFFPFGSRVNLAVRRDVKNRNGIRDAFRSMFGV